MAAIRIYILTYFLLGLQFVVAVSENIASIDEYLSRQLRQAKVDIAKAYSHDLPSDSLRSYDVNWKQLWSKPLNSTNAWALSFSDQTIVLADNRVLRADIDSGSASLTQLAVVEENKSAKFVRNILWKRMLYLLIGHNDGACSLYVSSNDVDLGHRQIVKHRGLPTDAQFFAQGNQLYLVVADNSGQFSVPSVIYRWTGSYMDVVREIATTGAVSVTTFGYKQSTIIIFAQNVQGRPRIGSEVFRFTKHSTVEKIQFLPTNAPMAMHHYRYDDKIFLLVVNEFVGCSVYFWDGKEFLNWMEIPEIKSPTTVDVVYTDTDTFLVATRMNKLSLYKILNFQYAKLDIMEVGDMYTIIDAHARVRGETIVLLLVMKSVHDNKYHIEPFELTVKKSDLEITEVEDRTWESLLGLKDVLWKRMASVHNSYKSWATLIPVAEDTVITGQLKIPELILEAGSVTEIFVESPEKVLTPAELSTALKDAQVEADSLLQKSRELLWTNETNFLTGRVVVEGDAFIDELHLDALYTNVVNDQTINLDSTLSYSKDQTFDDTLRGKSIVVRNLEVDSLCGIPYENWLLMGETHRTTVNLLSKDVKIVNNTIFVDSDLNLWNIGAERLNDVDLLSLRDKFFIVGVNQRIKGNITYEKGLSVGNMILDTANDVDATRFFTRTTNQHLGDFFIKNLQIDDLIVSDRINDVAIADAARVSKKNHIEGPITIQHLRVTDELIVDEAAQFSEIRPVQVYKNVEIVGDVRVKNLSLHSTSAFFVNGYKTSIDSVFNDHWTKSTKQVIANNVSLHAGITIDDLHSKYLNGYVEDDFLYTTVDEIPEKFGKLHFQNFELDGYLSVDGEEIIESFMTDDTLVVAQKLLVEELHARNINATSYNGVPIDVIFSDAKSYRISNNVSYAQFIVEDSIHVDNLEAQFIGERNLETFFRDVIYIDGNYELDLLRQDKLHAQKIKTEELNGLKMMQLPTTLQYRNVAGIRNITIEGNLRVLEDIRVDFINGIEVWKYLAQLTEQDLFLHDGMFTDFLINGNLTAKVLQGIDIDYLVANSLSRIKGQILPGEFVAKNIQAAFVDAAEFNTFDLRQIQVLSDRLIYNHDVTFDELSVRGDIVTGLVNDRDIQDMYEDALIVPYESLRNLTIEGSLSWEDPLISQSSFSYLVEKSVTKNTDQTIFGDVTFMDSICAFHVTTSENIGGVNVTEIVTDAVQSTGEPISIYGVKTFTKELTIGSLDVAGNIESRIIDGCDILELNRTIVRRFDDNVITGEKMFIKDVTIHKLEVGGKIHGASPNRILTVNDKLPDKTHFSQLQVQENLSVRILDGIDLDEFLKNRVTLNGDHEIYSDVIFQSPLSISRNVDVRFVNDVDLYDAAYADTRNIQIITSEKMFTKDLTIIGDISASMVNDLNLTVEYEYGVLNNEDAYFDGDVVFLADAKVSNVSINGLINGVVLDYLLQDISYEESRVIENLSTGQTQVDNIIEQCWNVAQRLPNELFYFDNEIDIFIGAPNIRKGNIVTFQSFTRLNLYGTENGSNCNLPDFCDCRTQYVAELAINECKIWQVVGTKIVYNFFHPEENLAFSVITTGISSSHQCTAIKLEDEKIFVSWMTPGMIAENQLGGDVHNEELNIFGYLSDVETFSTQGKIYIVLAIYYDASVKTHDVGTFIYELNSKENKVRFVQRIPTSGAIDLNIFTTNSGHIHLLIACLQNSPESQLHQFNITTSQFHLLRTFRTGGSRMVASLISGDETFVLLDEPTANSVHIFNYRHEFDNFYFYQSLFHESSINGVDVIYSDEFPGGDAFVIVSTEEGRFFLYEYMFYGGFQLRMQQWLDGVQRMIPFYYAHRRYIFAATNNNGTIYKIVSQGPINY